MYNYKFGYHSPEDSGEIHLCSQSHFNDEEFENLILSYVPEAFKIHIKQEEEYFKKVGREWKYKHIGFSDIYTIIADLLVASGIFERIEFATEYSVFGWNNLCVADEFVSYRDTKDFRLNKVVMDFCKEINFNLNEEDEEPNLDLGNEIKFHDGSKK